MNVFSAVILSAFNANAGDTCVITQHFIQRVIPLDSNIAIFSAFFYTSGKNLFRAELIASMHNSYMVCNIGQI